MHHVQSGTGQPWPPVDPPFFRCQCAGAWPSRPKETFPRGGLTQIAAAPGDWKGHRRSPLRRTGGFSSSQRPATLFPIRSDEISITVSCHCGNDPDHIVQSTFAKRFHRHMGSVGHASFPASSGGDLVRIVTDQSSNGAATNSSHHWGLIPASAGSTGSTGHLVGRPWSSLRQLSSTRGTSPDGCTLLLVLLCAVTEPKPPQTRCQDNSRWLEAGLEQAYS
jgi:hypothetical protein